MHNFTSNDLVLFLLNELDPMRRADLETYLAVNPDSQRELEELKQGLAEVEAFELQPHPKSMEIVLSELQQHRDLHIV